MTTVPQGLDRSADGRWHMLETRACSGSVYLTDSDFMLCDREVSSQMCTYCDTCRYVCLNDYVWNSPRINSWTAVWLSQNWFIIIVSMQYLGDSERDVGKSLQELLYLFL